MELYKNESLFWIYKSAEQNKTANESIKGQNGQKKEKETMARHWEPYIQIFLIQEGEVYFECNGRQMYAKKGQVVIINCNEMHFYKALIPKVSYVIFCFYPSFLGEKSSDICMEKYLIPIKENRIVFQSLIQKEGEIQLLLNELLKEYETTLS